jgi:hypothetical protein
MAAIAKTIFILAIGLNPMFIDMDQFDQDMDALGLPGFSFPLGARFGLGIHKYCKPEHAFRFKLDIAALGVESHKEGDYSQFSNLDTILFFGYGYRPVAWLDLYVEAGAGFSDWQYLLLSDQFDGHAKGRYWTLSPEVGLQFNLGKLAALNLFGKYHAEVGPMQELYSRDWTRDNFDDLDLNYFSAGIDYMLRFH